MCQIGIQLYHHVNESNKLTHLSIQGNINIILIEKPKPELVKTVHNDKKGLHCILAFKLYQSFVGRPSKG